ncbi:MAG TPA: biotin carboxylase N-terminal domain-containing protein, partial [Burkholderiaceae bacterium]|nr:biotin carboxylase N-terminal domain-containing protein [Burkholderiaceae bacterium]
MFSKILIANRGEIACRVAATARKLGIATVAVYSDADANARHVAACDEAWRLGPPPARESYLRGDAIVEIASRTGSQAIHPGYGFLSENEAFAQACADAGIAFIGPPASAIRAMGLKAESKRLMTQAGVPTVPGYHGDDQSPALLREQADRIGYPVLIKASAGGGGKGMRIVQRRAELDAALASCQREAAASFGNDAVLIERYLTRPRHIEIQVFADSHGGAVHLFERDCSVQRRHQKVIEEAPAPGLPQARRDAMGEAAIAAARAVGYVGAGTVEFIVDAGGEFFFMEMNTRLQVEHPVTEMITGLDLVEWQLRVAAGEPLPVRQDMLAIRGHSIEARIYAENPDKGFLPSVGTLRHLQMPPAVEFTTGLGSLRSDPAPVRIDSGVREGDPITPHYDPMIAKLIVWGADRAQAIGRMRQALQRFEVVGPATNVAFLDRLMASRSYVDADLDTALIERESKTLLAPPPPPGLRQLAVAAAAVLALEDEPARAGVPPGWAYDPWAARDGWRLNSTLSRTLSFAVGEHRHDVTVDHESADSLAVRDGEQRIRVASPSLRGRQLSLRLDDSAVIANVVADGETLHLFGP